MLALGLACVGISTVAPVLTKHGGFVCYSPLATLMLMSSVDALLSCLRHSHSFDSLHGAKRPIRVCVHSFQYSLLREGGGGKP